MGSNETAITIPGALEKLTFFTGTGRHRAQIIYFLWMQIGPWRSLGVGLLVGKRLNRLRHRCGSLALPESPPMPSALPTPAPSTWCSQDDTSYDDTTKATCNSWGKDYLWCGN